MTAKEIANKLRDKGFEVLTSANMLSVGLNRAVSITEVIGALDDKIEESRLEKLGKKVFIFFK